MALSTPTAAPVRVVCRPAQVSGFALAGLEADVAPDAARAAELLKRLALDARVGMVLVDEQLHRALPAELRQRLDRLAQPMITPFPSPAWDEAGAAEDYVLEILRQAIGYRVRPR
ncbi:MAG: V-type ATP synthase subunit F [Myxococcaceae bacterium]